MTRETDDKRRVIGAGGDKPDPRSRDGAGGSDSVRPSVLRTNWGRVISPTSHVDTDSTLTIDRPHTRTYDRDDAETHVVSRGGSGAPRREPRIAILGCGPAGMLAAHAVRLHGFRPDILSIHRKSVLSGAIYLHEPIPYLTSDVKSDIIKYAKIGTEEGYAEKVYGSPEAETSWNLYDGEFLAYSMKQAYSLLWIKYAHLVKDVDLARHSTPEAITAEYQVVISTVPALHLCMHKDIHDFARADIWVSHTIPDTTIVSDNTIVYNGNLNDPWYRASRIFGVASTEFSEGAVSASNLFPTNATKGVKPIDNNCTCNPRFHRVGRFGKWRKGILAHEVFRDTIDIMHGEGIVDALF